LWRKVIVSCFSNKGYFFFVKLFPALRCYLLRSCLAAKGYTLQSGLSLPRGPSFVWQQKKQKCLSDQITILKTTSERGLRAKPLALQARLSRPPMPLFFIVFYDSNLTSHQVGSVYFIFRWLRCTKNPPKKVP
jgi:hypothetical protein